MQYLKNNSKKTKNFNFSSDLFVNNTNSSLDVNNNNTPIKNLEIETKYPFQQIPQQQFFVNFNNNSIVNNDNSTTPMVGFPNIFKSPVISKIINGPPTSIEIIKSRIEKMKKNEKVITEENNYSTSTLTLTSTPLPTFSSSPVQSLFQTKASLLKNESIENSLMDVFQSITTTPINRENSIPFNSTGTLSSTLSNQLHSTISNNNDNKKIDRSFLDEFQSIATTPINRGNSIPFNSTGNLSSTSSNQLHSTISNNSDNNKKVNNNSENNTTSNSKLKIDKKRKIQDNLNFSGVTEKQKFARENKNQELVKNNLTFKIYSYDNKVKNNIHNNNDDVKDDKQEQQEEEISTFSATYINSYSCSDSCSTPDKLVFSSTPRSTNMRKTTSLPKNSILKVSIKKNYIINFFTI